MIYYVPTIVAAVSATVFYFIATRKMRLDTLKTTAKAFQGFALFALMAGVYILAATDDYLVLDVRDGTGITLADWITMTKFVFLPAMLSFLYGSAIKFSAIVQYEHSQGAMMFRHRHKGSISGWLLNLNN